MRKIARTLHDAEQLIREQKPFRLRGGDTRLPPSLWATTEAPDAFGYIPAENSEGAESADYWVFSYRTLIAWVAEGEPTVPDVGYSPTTGQHQYLAASALGVDFHPARNRGTVEIPRNDSQYGVARRLRRGGMDGPSDIQRAEDAADRVPGLRRPERTEPDQHGYTHPATDGMRWRPSGFAEQNELINEVSGWSRSHP